MKTRILLLVLLICVPLSVRSQSRLDDQVKPLVSSFKGNGGDGNSFINDDML